MLMHLLRFSLGSLAFVAVSSVSGWSQVAITNVRPAVRVTQSVDSAVTARIAGTHPSAVDGAAVSGRVASSTAMTDMKLVLSSSDAQIAALRSLADQQQDKTSPNYHKWLTPETFGQYFGPAPADVAKVTAWLQDQGFTVNSVAKSNRVITFSGTAGQVEAAFHTQMNHVSVSGEDHVSNTSDIAIPAALAPVVMGVASLNNLFAKSNAVNPHTGQIQTQVPVGNYVTQTASPLYTSVSSGSHYVGPGDAATIFNSNPLLAGGIDGTGQTVAVLARSNVTLSDVQSFRSIFGLKKNDPTFTLVSNDPGQNSDDIEAYLDIEWAGAMAPGANVNFILGGSSFVADGIGSAGLYAVDNNIGDIISLSYGGCESGNGASGTAFWNSLWEQAAAQGQSVFVSTGDSGAAGCNSSSATYGSSGFGVNALGSSAYNVAVGGSMFVDFGPSQFWAASSGAPYSTATSYIPEAAWNEGSLSTTYLDPTSTVTVTGSGIVGGGGGVSIYTARPSWQTGSGISPSTDPAGIAAGSPISGLHRLVPDVSLVAASGHTATIFCSEGTCFQQAGGTVGSVGLVGGTSVATPVMASVQALINQKNGGRQGNANYFYYPLANAQYAASTTACQAVNGTAGSTSVTLPAATCNFHDIVAGSNVVKANSSDTTGFGFRSGVGFDEATGLGSVNIANVANNWSTVSFRATTTTFTLSPAEGVNHGAPIQLAVKVAPTSGTGTPGGDIELIAETVNPLSRLTYTLSGGAVNGNVTGLPAGSYKVHVHYAGDGTFGSSDSASIPVVIGQEGSKILFNSYAVFSNGSYSVTNAFAYGTLVDVDTQVAGTSGTGTPSGTVTFGILKNGVALPSLTTKLDTNADTYIEAGATFTPYYLTQNYPALAPGAYSVTANYSGDTSFAASSATTSFSVVPATPAVTFSTASSSVTNGAPVTLNYSIASPGTSTFLSSASIATGTVTFTVQGGSGGPNTVALVNGAAVFTGPFNVPSNGTYVVQASYSGDGNYAAATSTLNVVVGAPAATTTTLTDTTTTYVGTTTPLRATVSPIGSATVYFYDGGVLIGTAVASGTTGIATLNYSGFKAGSHNLSAMFTGNSTLAASTGTMTLTVNQNVTALFISAPSTSTYGQAVAMNAKITRNPTIGSPLVSLTGVVNFYDSGVLVGTATPIYESGYQVFNANINMYTLGAGSHSLSATYVGDANYASSSSISLTTNIAKLTAPLTLSTTATSFNGVASIPLTAVFAVPSTLAAPAGNISFYDGATLLGSAATTYSTALGGYVATFTASGLSGTSHSLTAQFAGDTNYNAATSFGLNVTVLTNNVWIANANGTVSAVSNQGLPVTSSGVGSSGTGIALAVDGSGNVWSLDTANSRVSEFSRAGTVISAGYTAGGINAPKALAFDGAGLLWIANGNNTLSVLNSNGAAVTTPYTSVLSAPTSVNVDGSGNVWITNSGSNTVTEVIGAATPVTTPQTTAVTNNSLAAKP
jgi:subtilase family serine protease